MADPRADLERLADEIERRGVDRPDTDAIARGERPVSVGQGPDGAVYVDHRRTEHATVEEAAASLGPNTFTIDTRPRVVVRLSEITDGPVTGWRTRCDACPGYATDKRKSTARKRAFYHGQKHEERGHKVIIDEPIRARRTRKARRR